MAEWKKIIFENVKASLDGVSTKDVDAVSGDIGKVGTGAITKLYGLTAVPSPVISGDLTVVISSSNGFAHTSSNAFVNAMASNPLRVPAVGGLDLDSGTSYDGSDVRTITIDDSQLNGNGLVNTDNLINVGQGNNISVGGTTIAVSSTALADNDFGLKMVSNKLQIATGSGFKFGASGTGGPLTKLAPNETGGVKGALLTGGDGITISNTSFDYADAETITLSVSDFAGTGIVSTTNNLNLATSSLESGTGSLWSGDDLQGSGISFGTDTILIARANVLAPGIEFNVQGTANYAHESDVEISDKILLINSASSQFGATAKFGFLGQTGSAAHGISLFYSGSGTADDTGWNMGSVSNIGTNEPGTKKGRIRLHIGHAEAEPNTLTLTDFQKSTGNSYFDTGDTDGGFYVYV